MWRMSSIRRLSSGLSAQNKVARARRLLLCASRMLSSTVWLSNTVGFWNLRPMPSSAISASSSRVRSAAPSNITSPSSGRVLPVITSIIVVLPAPLGPMTLRSSPRSTMKESPLSALKPSKLTVTPSR